MGTEQQTSAELRALRAEVAELRRQMLDLTRTHKGVNSLTQGWRGEVLTVRRIEILGPDESENYHVAIEGNKTVLGGDSVVGTFTDEQSAVEVQSTGTGAYATLAVISRDETTPANSYVVHLSVDPPFGAVSLRSSSTGAFTPKPMAFMVGNDVYMVCDPFAAPAVQVGIGGTIPIQVSGTGTTTIVGNTVRLVTAARTPANSAEAGNDGEVCADSSYVYVHTGGSWRRAAIAAF